MGISRGIADFGDDFSEQQTMDTLGTKIRRQRRRLGLTLDDLAGRAGISKPYLSVIETGRVTNPPSDAKIRRLEQSLGFTPDELLTQAHLMRIPRDVRGKLSRLLGSEKVSPEGSESQAARIAAEARNAGDARIAGAGLRPGAASISGTGSALGAGSASGAARVKNASRSNRNSDAGDAALLSTLMRDSLAPADDHLQKMAAGAVPVINRAAAGYPTDFTDLSYPPRVANEYIGCPDVADKDAFAARVHGDSMLPKYREGDIVVFSPGASPRNGDDCFIRFSDGQTTFKRIFFENDLAGPSPTIRLQPRNERYRPETFALANVSGLYRAAYRLQKVEDE